MITTWPAPAKLNLFLYITGQRSDGYHYLQTLFQFLDYSDQISIQLTDDGGLHLITGCHSLSHPDNLILKAAKLLRCSALAGGRVTPSSGATLTLEKRIPMGGGLGGGSSNAATTLVALNQLWQINYSTEQLLKLGVKLGADVPVFISGVTAFAEGIGEQLQPSHAPEKFYLVAHPGIEIATPSIFKAPELRRDTPARPLSELLTATWRNDCEAVVRKRFPVVEELLKWLLQYAPARLTGTGACSFAEFDTESAANQVLKQLPARFSGFVTKGVNRSPLYTFKQGEN